MPETTTGISIRQKNRRSESKESLIAGRHNQIRFPLSGTFAYAAHDDTLRSKRPKIGIQILYNHVCFYTAFFQAVRKPAISYYYARRAVCI